MTGSDADNVFIILFQIWGLWSRKTARKKGDNEMDREKIITSKDRHKQKDRQNEGMKKRLLQRHIKRL